MHRGGFDPPRMHGIGAFLPPVRYAPVPSSKSLICNQATAAKPLDPEAILFYILDIWLMYQRLWGQESAFFHMRHIAHVKRWYKLWYTQIFLE